MTGVWSNKAAKEAEKYMKVNYVLPKLEKFTKIHEPVQWTRSTTARYAYYCANETVHGTCVGVYVCVCVCVSTEHIA